MDLKEFVRLYYIKKKGNDNGFEESYEKYLRLPYFKINENIHEKVDYYDEDVHLVLQGHSLYYAIKLFEAMKVDMSDDNVMDNDYGTPYRLVKMLTGKNLDDDTELLSGRFVKEPNLKSFQNTSYEHHNSSKETTIKNHNIVIKKFDVVSVCSHHLAPFSTKFSKSYGFVAFIPTSRYLGLSKISRYVRYISRRGWLQEELTNHLHKKLCEKMETENVMVGIVNCVHLCEYIRGIEDEHSSYTTFSYSGVFEDESLRKEVLTQILPRD